MASLQTQRETWGHTLIWNYSGRNFVKTKLIKFKTSWCPEHRDRLPAPPRHTLHPQYPHPPRCPSQLQSWTWFLSAGSDVFYPDISPLCRPTSHMRRHCNEHRLFFMRFARASRYWGLTSHCSQLRSLPRPCISSRWEHKLKIFLSNWKIFSSNSISEIENKWISQGCVVKIFLIAASCKVKQRKCKQIKEFVLQKQSLLKVYRWFIPFP